MLKTAPHYLLLTETDYDPANADSGGRWRFVLESMNNDERVEVSEREVDVWGERLQLLAVVRGVEALEQPSKVTLVTSSQVVGQRIRQGFESWIEKEWRWERFGLMKPIAHTDLWQRIHAATLIHQIECRVWQFNRHRNHQFAEASLFQDSRKFSVGPAEFEDSRSIEQPRPAAEPAFSETVRFVPTRTGWAREESPACFEAKPAQIPVDSELSQSPVGFSSPAGKIPIGFTTVTPN